VRATVKARLEERAAREGRGCITLEFMRECRPPFDFVGRAFGRHLPPEAAIHGDIANGGDR